MSEVRSMTQGDIEASCDVAKSSWEDVVRKGTGLTIDFPRRSSRLVRSYMRRDPDGCLVAVSDGEVIGSSFAHAMGDVGWIGPIEVSPRHQGAGVGKELMRRSISYLQGKGATSIYVETMSDVPENIRFYWSLGFRIDRTVRMMSKSLDGVGEPPSSAPDAIGMAKALWPEVDVASSIDAAMDGLGHVIADEGGMVILHTYPRATDSASIRLALSESYAGMAHLLSVAESLAVADGRSMMLVRFASDDDMHDMLSDMGYSSSGDSIRMLLGEGTDPGCVAIISYAG